MNLPSNHADLLIIGGGVLGTFHAFHALQRGLSVVLLERHAAPRGATVRNFGQVVPSGMDSQWQAHGRESLRIYQSIQSHFDISVRQQGSIFIASDEEELTLLEELRSINADNEYPSEILTAQACQDRYPLLRSDYCRGGLFFPQEISVNPLFLIHRLQRFLAEKPQFQSRFQCTVRELECPAGDRVVATTNRGETFTAEKAILCCGSEIQTLFPDLFAESDLQASKLQMLRLKPQPAVSLAGNILTGLSIRRYECFAQCPSWSAIKSREASDSYAQQWGVHILFKQEADGGIILGDSHEYAPASQFDKLDFQVRQDLNEYFINQGRLIFDLPSWEIESSWFGVYCQTKDPSGVFTKTLQNHIHVVTGIGGKGMTSSPGFAKYHLGEIYND
ncbi:MAG: TIGR03364 family FAD-dependent oxidoreductase [Planctomycetaceae bacterium]|nr:TIGR03364 family FAD-dependent oxidoreductase [Planctomycetaceae bacterium]